MEKLTKQWYNPNQSNNFSQDYQAVKGNLMPAADNSRNFYERLLWSIDDLFRSGRLS
jgi:hypothetical protein